VGVSAIPTHQRPVKPGERPEVKKIKKFPILWKLSYEQILLTLHPSRKKT
jgi:hypothetical protein